MHPHSQATPWLLAVGAFALGMASYITAGLIPLIETELSVSVSLAAQLVTAFTLAYGIGSPLLVAMLPSDCQRAGLLAALGLFVVANAASALAGSMYLLMGLRVLAGFAAGTFLAVGIAAAVEVSTEKRRGKSISLIMGGMASGTVLGVPVGLILAQQWGWQVAFWLIAVIGLVALLGLVWRLPDLPSATPSPLSERLQMLSDMRVLRLLLVSLFAAIASLGLYTFFAPLLDSYDVTTLTPFLWVWGVGGMVGSLLIGVLVDRCSGPRLTLGIMLLLGASLLALPVVMAWSPWSGLLPIALWGAVGWALQVPQNDELMKARRHRGDGNLAVALNESALYLGSAIGALIGGVALSGGLAAPWLAVGAGSVALIGAMLQIDNLPLGMRTLSHK
ncbi:MFS transporter [Halomonas maura]|uniref:MFS transporter n=1 Tax=Halomonas maura TaxID=117606 RepID=UPI0025B37663|nr:MFS transporter [Halomonas maura]MDN3555739.1 MFS transporter [Halomonas maura]